MSRIGKKPIDLPKGVKVSVSGGTITAEGPKGTLTYDHRPEVSVAVAEDGAAVNVTVDDSLVGEREVRAYWGLTRALVQNMVIGVEKGYEKKLVIEGVGWNAQMAGQQLKMQLGYAHPVLMDVPMGLTVTADKQEITITGADKQAVGQFAAAARSKRPPEPYNGKGVRYSDERIARKEGKKAK
ncbi:MAG: 50S ribosomal protein L6 [Planctomycetota bacterium]